MVLSLCLCLLSGFLLGTRYRVYVLLPASGAAMLLAWGVAVAAGLPCLASVALLVLLPAGLQAGYGAALVIQLRSSSEQSLGLRTP